MRKIVATAHLAPQYYKDFIPEEAKVSMACELGRIMLHQGLIKFEKCGRTISGEDLITATVEIEKDVDKS